jgi:dihydrodipicolinate reductase
MTRVAIAGIETDLGQALIEQIETTPGLDLAGGIATRDRASLPRVLDGAHVLIDLSKPELMMHNAIVCLSMGCALVAGCGPLDPNYLAELREFSSRIPIFHAPNLCFETAAVLSILPLLRDALPHLEAEFSSNGSSAPVAFLTGGGQEILLAQKVYGPVAEARGAIRAARFLSGQTSGFYSMHDLLPAGSGQREPARVW